MDKQMAMDNSDRKVRHFCKSFWKVLVKHTISSTECATGNKGEWSTAGTAQTGQYWSDNVRLGETNVQWICIILVA